MHEEVDFGLLNGRNNNKSKIEIFGSFEISHARLEGGDQLISEEEAHTE